MTNNSNSKYWVSFSAIFTNPTIEWSSGVVPYDSEEAEREIESFENFEDFGVDYDVKKLYFRSIERIGWVSAEELDQSKEFKSLVNSGTCTKDIPCCGCIKWEICTKKKVSSAIKKK